MQLVSLVPISGAEAFSEQTKSSRFRLYLMGENITLLSGNSVKHLKQGAFRVVLNESTIQDVQ